MSPPTHLIRSIEPLHIGQFLIVRIETNHNVVSYGEAGVWGHIEAAATAVRLFGTYLFNKPAFAIEHHWNVMHRFSYFQGSKVLSVPIYELLGGTCRTKARDYGHIYEKTIDGVLAECKRKKNLGYTAFGHINPFLDEGDEPYFKTHIQKMEHAAESVRRMREAVGNKVDLLIALHRRLTPAEAVTFSGTIEQYRPMYVEDPIRPENVDAMASVAERIPVPVATGERYSTIYEFHAALSRGALEYVRIDVGLCGGITGAKKVAAMAEAHNV